jgi:hypothetical protein
MNHLSFQISLSVFLRDEYRLQLVFSSGMPTKHVQQFRKSSLLEKVNTVRSEKVLIRRQRCLYGAKRGKKVHNYVCSGSSGG